MKEENPTRDTAQQAPQDSNSPRTATPQKPTAHEGSHTSEEQEAQAVENLEKGLGSFERAMIRLTFFGVVVAGITGAFIYSQFRAVVDQNQILSAQAISATAGAIAGELITKKQIGELKRSADEMHKQVLAAQGSADLLKRQMILDQRPWVGILGIETTGHRHTYDTAQIDRLTIHIRNSGKTPALKFQLDCCLEENRPWTAPEPTSESVIADRKRSSAENVLRLRKRDARLILEHPESAGSIRQQEKQIEAVSIATDKTIWEGTRSEQAIAPNVVFSRILISGYGWNRRGADGHTPLVLYLLGKITYYDILERTVHTTTICIKNDPGAEQEFALCRTGNSMN